MVRMMAQIYFLQFFYGIANLYTGYTSIMTALGRTAYLDQSTIIK